MARQKIFISYSHKDSKAREQLERFLKALERQGTVDWWGDTRLEGGDNWKEEIDRALEETTAAVLLISQDFLASSFIMTKEVPGILARHAAGELLVLPVFLSPSMVEQEGLGNFQGYGTPDKPLSSWPSREREFKKLAKRLTELVQPPGSAPAETIRSPAVASRKIVSTPPARSYELTLQLERRGEMLAMSASERGDGEALFQLLLGSEQQWEPVLRTAFGRPVPAPRPNPVWAPLRVRIATEDALLANLPWRLTSWSGRPLIESGWSFSTTQVLDATADVTTTAPANVLIVAPSESDHVAAIKDLLARVWPTGQEQRYVRVVVTRQQLEHALRGMKPHLVYVYGSGEMHSQQPALLLAGERLTLSRFARFFEEAGHWPAAVYLNVEGWSATELPPIGSVLGTGVSVVIWRVQRERAVESTTLALAWLHSWLGEGKDPVAALHEVTRDEIATSPEAATLAVASNYRTWSTARYLGAERKQLARLQLDRESQKALVAKHVGELAASGSRRVLALVAYASPGHLLGEHWRQLRHHLDLATASVAEIDWLHLELPPTRDNLRRDLEPDLAAQLRAEADEPIEHLLRRHAPRAVGAGKRPILWLDWGVFGSETGDRGPLTPAQLGDWLRFSSEFLAARCPDDLRIVSYLAIELEEAKHKRLASALQEHHRQPWCHGPRFWLRPLPPLGEVAQEDLFDFLGDPKNTDCDPGIRVEVAQRLIAKTGGNFEQTIALIESADQGSWYDLLDRLRREQGAQTLGDEEPF